MARTMMEWVLAAACGDDDTATKVSTTFDFTSHFFRSASTGLGQRPSSLAVTLLTSADDTLAARVAPDTITKER
jgi:hypothetical protein